MSGETSTESGRSSGSLSTSVLERALVGDQGAFRKITDLCDGLVYSWCRKQGLTEEDAKDVSQEVFTTVAMKLGNFRRESSNDSFRAWIRTITKNKIADHYRAEKLRIQAIAGQVVDNEIPEPPLVIELDDDPARETAELYQRAVQLIRQQFSERDFQVFWRITVDGMSGKDVAEEFGMKSNGNVFTVVSRIKKRVREEFGDLIDEGDQS